MFFIFISFVCVLLALVAGGLSAWSDFKGMIIPNRYPLAILGVFFLAYGASYGMDVSLFSPFLSHLLSGVIVFILTFLLFSMGLFGGGDAKLLSAYALWMGMGGLADFIAYVAIIGGFIAVFALCVKRFKPFKVKEPKSWIGQLQGGKAKIAYGLAIFFGAFLSFFLQGYITFFL